MLADGTADITLGGVLAGNEAGVHGGGVAALEGAAVRIASTTHLRANAAQGSGGGAFLAGATSVIGAPPRPPRRAMLQLMKGGGRRARGVGAAGGTGRGRSVDRGLHCWL